MIRKMWNICGSAGSEKGMSEFADLVDAHYEGLYRFGYSLTRNPDSASDLVQETFCIWAEKGHQLLDRTKAKTWLFTTLYRQFLGQRRFAQRFVDGEFEESLESVEVAPEDHADRQMDGQRAVELLSELDEIYRAPLALFYLQQNSYKEIAAVLEIPMGTVMSRISRAKGMLKRRMTGESSSAPKNILHLEPETLEQRHGKG